MTVLYSAYLPFLMPRVRPLLPQPLALQALRTAAIEFCKISRYWHVLQANQAVLAITSPRNIPVTPPTGGQCWMPLWLEWRPTAGSTTGIQRLNPITPQELDDECPGWRAHAETQGTPEFFLTRSEGNLIVAPWPATDGAVDFDMSYIPTMASTGSIDELFNLFCSTIVKGAQAELLQMPGKPWTDLVVGVALDREFRKEAADVMVREDRGRTEAIITTRTEYR